MEKVISNFTKSHQLKVSADMHGTCGALVSLEQWAGSTHFFFSMHPDQARELGTTLYALADSLDAETKEAA